MSADEMLAALNEGRAFDDEGNPFRVRAWGILSDDNGAVVVERCISAEHALSNVQTFYRGIPAVVVSRIGGWQVVQ